MEHQRVISHLRVYICDFCPQKIESDSDGMVIFGSVCILGPRGLIAKVGEVPNDMNFNQIEKIKTCICFKCFARKTGILDNPQLKPVEEKPAKSQKKNKV